MKTITLYDVARLAGVSYQTVSRVINQGEHVSTRTRDKVLAAMAELHYIPNRGAQQLAGKRTKTLGLLTSDLALHAPSQIASAVKSRATQFGVNVIISMPEEQDARGSTAALQDLLAQRVDGLLVNVPLDDEQAEALSALAGPVPVLFLDVSETAAVNSLIFDADPGGKAWCRAFAGTGAFAYCVVGRAAIIGLCKGQNVRMAGGAGGVGIIALWL